MMSATYCNSLDFYRSILEDFGSLCLSLYLSFFGGGGSCAVFFVKDPDPGLGTIVLCL